MQTVMERVMQTYGMMHNLTAEQQLDAKGRLQEYLASRDGSEQELAVLGLQFLRGSRKSRSKAIRIKRG